MIYSTLNATSNIGSSMMCHKTGLAYRYSDHLKDYSKFECNLFFIHYTCINVRHCNMPFYRKNDSKL